ncbi:MAG: hypothetical protein HKN58_02105 [Xanthomonadales bacterium]|nr:hypothetical protein [Xanthomonadales bacterium]
MKWLQNNPLGVALAAACGVLVLCSALLLFAWGQPASSGEAGASAGSLQAATPEHPQTELEPIAAYRIVTERPVFDESRRPVVVVEGEGIQIAEDGGSDVGERPQVKPTGIVITPDAKMVTLKPESGGDPILAIEGRPLEGEYVGWIVSDIKPREITLASLDGDVMKLGLEVNTRKIAEPPKPPPEPDADELALDQARGQGDGTVEGDEEPMSRAEQIRQRIAERREELRRQAEADRSEADSTAGTRAAQYQSAIRNLIRSRNQDDEEKKNEGGDSNDG